MATMSPALAASPIVRFTPDELAYRGDGIPRDASGKPLPWVWEYLTETQRRQLEQERKEGDR
ncbi:hypothetical protein LF916_00445 [Bifidobacterium pseudolongum]|uniref:Uncharacterized protein n=1 Tax=Bifidobacterium pseudolongum subsp. globosum TaxID=1690 RepID=A0A4Q5AP43_9BIFI|nr:hypothetical protein [Bifidobacterium pseudolongum]MCH4859372.1 hypothetical protein [Bifidobacterium pseudolongum]MCH4861143.1 hypothetical protein [Bifidobacterium pseudolongum]RYQ02192.1 hypothetical protein PG2115B_0166 [Bifidobacterium pseudolongum subsp. globosum]RYQ23145.1 hypothetical protein PG2049B_0145 [Bifidobacterium pseudolongum subsp. globosum]RYQ31601.1 hypothetical protein PG2017B_0145 [Bifidobacterium pseudolongum subsp. globosum]